VAFITYSLTGHPLNAAIIFSALQQFNIIKYPLQNLPNSLSAVLDSMSGMRKSQ